MSPISSAVFSPSLAKVDIPRPPIASFGRKLSLLTGGIGGGRPSSESVPEPEPDEYEASLGLFLASYNACISPSSSAVLPPSLATVDRPRPPIASPGILNPPAGFETIGGGNPMSESEDESLFSISCF